MTAKVHLHTVTDLVGRKVTFTPTTLSLDTKIRQMFGVYKVLPHGTAVVVKADLQLLASLAGVLVELPDSAVKEHLKANLVEELLRDAIYEVFNIASAAVSSEGRGGSARCRRTLPPLMVPPDKSSGSRTTGAISMSWSMVTRVVISQYLPSSYPLNSLILESYLRCAGRKVKRYLETCTKN